jgi:hypothetical protein
MLPMRIAGGVLICLFLLFNLIFSSFTLAAGESIALSPNSGNRSSKIVVQGSGFPVNPGAPLKLIIKWDNIDILTVPVDTMTINSGNFSFTISVPAQTSPGIHTITASLASQFATPAVMVASASAQFTLVGSFITLTPDSGTGGTSVTVKGDNFPVSPGSPIKMVFRWDSDINSIQSNPQEVIISSDGTFTASISVPALAAPGQHTITASPSAPFVGIYDTTSTAKFNISTLQAGIILVPNSGIASTTIKGTNFPVYPGYPTRVTIKWDNNPDPLPTVPEEVLVSNAGTFSAIIAVPTQTSPGAHTVSATGTSSGTNQPIPVTISGKFTVVEVMGSPGARGDAGPAGTGIKAVKNDSEGVLSIEFTDGKVFKSASLKGPRGEQGPPGEQGPARGLSMAAIILAVVALGWMGLSVLKKILG